MLNCVNWQISDAVKENSVPSYARLQSKTACINIRC